MSLITKPFNFSLMKGRCWNCNKKLPKKLAYWCNAYCANKYYDKIGFNPNLPDKGE